ncbi:MAG: 7-cyano-7-deazaguanine synthase QueC [Candidatus Dadabacteria bacterium]|nr:7-cyano-7-deazaguanine synthase QueC [Candidatus Dadabacteria bacterium]
MDNKKAVVIVSGGIDSSTLLYTVSEQGFDIHALTFIYGQKHIKEIESARKVCSMLGVSHRVVDLSALKGLLSGSALTDSTIDIPEVPETLEHYGTLAATIVPNRNAIFLSIGVGLAVSAGAGRVYFGAHHSDRGVYPDCRREFIEAFEAAERLATDVPGLRVEAPFVDMNKSEIVSLGASLGVPYDITWSCYKGGQKHCGVCSSCRERKRAFAESGVADPTRYEG